MTQKETTEYMKLKGYSLNGTMTIVQALKYFQLRDKEKKGKKVA